MHGDNQKQATSNRLYDCSWLLGQHLACACLQCVPATLAHPLPVHALLGSSGPGTSYFFCCFLIWVLGLNDSTHSRLGPDRLTPLYRWPTAQGVLYLLPFLLSSPRISLKVTRLSTCLSLPKLRIPWLAPKSPREVHIFILHPANSFSLELLCGTYFLSLPGYMEFAPELAQNFGGNVGHFLPHSSPITYVLCVPPQPTQEWGWICHKHGYQ